MECLHNCLVWRSFHANFLLSSFWHLWFYYQHSVLFLLSTQCMRVIWNVIYEILQYHRLALGTRWTHVTRTLRIRYPLVENAGLSLATRCHTLAYAVHSLRVRYLFVSNTFGIRHDRSTNVLRSLSRGLKLNCRFKGQRMRSVCRRFRQFLIRSSYAPHTLSKAL